MTRRQLRIFRIVALLLPFFALILLEIGLRVGGYGFDPRFFKQIRIGGENFFVQNDDFSFSFFPRAAARSPGELRMRAVKPPGTYRIFVFGESEAMGDPDPAYGPARYMEAQLREKFPDTKFEIINVAFTAINSHAIVPIARECAEHAGDLWIIYTGNNEMVGPYGAATVFGWRAPPLPYVRLATAIQRTRTGQLFAAIARRLARHGAKSNSWDGMQMFVNNEISPASPLKDNVYRNFQKNLDDIIRAGVNSGARVLLNTVAVNLKDCPPFASLTNNDLAPVARAQFAQHCSAAQQAEMQGNFAVASQLCDSAAKIDPQCASLQYLWGQCLLVQSNFPAAREHLQLACDDDALPFRADSRINTLIRDAAQKAGPDGVVLLDAANALATNNAAGVCGQETFYEHVHFNFDGGYRLGFAWAQQVEKLLPASVHRSGGAWASEEKCDDLLGLSDWNRALVFEHMTGRLQVPPFSSQPNNLQRVEDLQARVSQLHSRMDAGDAAAARTNFERQLESWPDDFELHENFALFLQAAGDVTQSIAEWRRVHELMPQDYLSCFQMGRLLGSQGQLAEAESDLRMAVRIRPALTEGWFELGNVLVLQQRYSEALASYAVARRQEPDDAETVLRTGKVFALLNRHIEAAKYYRQAIQLNPTNWEPHFELGGELDASGQLDSAREEFATAVKLNPGYSRAHFNYGVLLAKQGRIEEAQREFAETLRLEPGYKNAEDALAKVRALVQGSGKN